MKIFRIIGLAAALSAAPANAQIAPGMSGSSTLQIYSGQMAWDTLSEFGICMAAREQKATMELISTRAGSADEVKVYKRLFRDDNQGCLGMTNELQVPYQLVRGSLGEGLYRKAVPVPATLRVTTPPAAAEVRNFADAALCYAAANRDGVRSLAKTRVGSKEEYAALSRMLPEMGSCFPPNAQKMPKMDSTLMRFRLTEAFWRLGEVPESTRK